MKTIFLALAATAFLATAANKTQAQIALNLEAPTAVKAATGEASVNMKASKGFQKAYTNAAHVNWNIVKDGFIAHFENNGITTQVGYNKHGNVNYEILRYNEAGLPADVRKQVNAAYEDYDITGVDEVHMQNHTTYFVHLEGKKSFKTIRINDDNNMDVYENFRKQL